MKKRGLVILVLILLILPSIYSIEEDEEVILPKQIYDIKENIDFLNGKPVSLDLSENSTISFNVLEDECVLSFSQIQKQTQIVVFSLNCGQENQDIPLKKAVMKQLDVDYDDIQDIELVLDKINVKSSVITVSIKKIVETKEKTNYSSYILLLIAAGIGLYFFYTNKTAKTNYNKVKDLIEKIENHLSLKENSEAKRAYLEAKELYDKLTLKQQKELYDKITELFKQFK